jgi:nitroimidazol reductase NimA-like FMN-containing flavoprotein (pyridoxamine 5'-phosphate oxidase superfamily)
LSAAPSRLAGMDIKRMTKEEAADFLAQPLVAVLAIDEPGWPPHVTPVWFHHRPADGTFVVMTDAASKKARLHREGSGELSLCVEGSEGATARYVNVQGTATFQPLPPEVVRTVAEKYLPPDFVEAYVAEPPEDSMFEIVPRRIVTGVIG